jgi:hypothetical protein
VEEIFVPKFEIQVEKEEFIQLNEIAGSKIFCLTAGVNF